MFYYRILSSWPTSPRDTHWPSRAYSPGKCVCRRVCSHVRKSPRAHADVPLVSLADSVEYIHGTSSWTAGVPRQGWAAVGGFPPSFQEPVHDDDGIARYWLRETRTEVSWKACLAARQSHHVTAIAGVAMASERLECASGRAMTDWPLPVCVNGRAQAGQGLRTGRGGCPNQSARPRVAGGEGMGRERSKEP